MYVFSSKRSVKRIGALLAMVLLFGLCVQSAVVHESGGYFHDSAIGTFTGTLRSGIGFDSRYWMSGLPDSMRISELWIPGTHDTMARGVGGGIIETQTLTLESS